MSNKQALFVPSWTVPNDLKCIQASFSPILTDWLCLQVSQTPRFRDLAIFVVTTTARQTDLLLHPYTCTWGNNAVVKPAVQNTYKPCRSRKCIRGHILMHAIFAVFIYFFIPVQSRSCFTSRTLDKDQKIEQLFYFLLVQVV